jgi:spore coat protein JB
LCPERRQLLLQIMAEEFTAVELNLFLDTHPEDKKALHIYNETVERLQELKQRYEDRFGPLTNFGYAPSDFPWQWVNEPWPWEINFAKEKGAR